jgi:YihY family inner membrane protein
VGTTDRLDRYQREHSWLGFPLAVLYKLADDRGPHLAALVTYYAFVSLFPLLLLFVSAAGFFLDGEPHLRQRIIAMALKNLAVLGPDVRRNISGFHGSGAALAVGIIGTLYGALGAMQAAQAAFNQINGVPRNEQPNPLKSRLRSLGLVALLGIAVIISTGIASLAATANGISETFGIELRVAAYGLSFAINIALFTAAFQLLTASELKTRHVITGGLIAGASWEALQVFGSRYVAHEVQHGSSLYGVFGVVLAAIAWIYLQALALMLSAEINVVLHNRLWPRALLTPFTDNVELTDADQRAYAMYARTQRFKGFEKVDTDFSKG